MSKPLCSKATTTTMFSKSLSLFLIISFENKKLLKSRTWAKVPELLTTELNSFTKASAKDLSGSKLDLMGYFLLLTLPVLLFICTFLVFKKNAIIAAIFFIGVILSTSALYYLKKKQLKFLQKKFLIQAAELRSKWKHCGYSIITDYQWGTDGSPFSPVTFSVEVIRYESLEQPRVSELLSKHRRNTNLLARDSIMSISPEARNNELQKTDRRLNLKDFYEIDDSHSLNYENYEELGLENESLSKIRKQAAVQDLSGYNEINSNRHGPLFSTLIMSRINIQEDEQNGTISGNLKKERFYDYQEIN